MLYGRIKDRIDVECLLEEVLHLMLLLISVVDRRNRPEKPYLHMAAARTLFDYPEVGNPPENVATIELCCLAIIIQTLG
jgi:hypothetical protein